MNSAVDAQSLLATAPSKHHHGSHRDLLTHVSVNSITASNVDAIVVPTARHPASLHAAMDVTAQLGCPLIALCSKWADAPATVALALSKGIEAIVVDTTSLPSRLMPCLETTALMASTRFRLRTDTSLKRNLGLLLTRLIGWQRIVFLDDDISIPEPSHLNCAVGLLGRYAGVGLWNSGFPDNSVVCHAFRESGGLQETFIGGGALAAHSTSTNSFFPNIYNDDWFFLLDEVQLQPSAVTGQVVQRPYDPFANDQRARMEEFGDSLAEGVFWLLDQGMRVQDADADYWRTSLDRRQQFLSDVLERVVSMHTDQGQKGRMVNALKAARGRSQLITPDLCVEYLRAWCQDRERWRRHVDALYRTYRKKTLRAPDTALSALGLLKCGKYVPPSRSDDMVSLSRQGV